MVRLDNDHLCGKIVSCYFLVRAASQTYFDAYLSDNQQQGGSLLLARIVRLDCLQGTELFHECLARWIR
jgi:hypothetical protein